MRTLFLLLIILLINTTHAGELEQAYQKEFAYLVAEKMALEQRLENLKTSQQESIEKISREIGSLQEDFLSRQNQVDRLNRQISEASRGVDYVENDNLLLDTTLIQARESLSKLNHEIDESVSLDKQLSEALVMANELIVNDGHIVSSQGQYFLPNGDAVEGEIVNVGRIAKYGVGIQGSGILAPAGNGMFKVWSEEAKATVEQMVGNSHAGSIDVFLYDNVEKGIEKQDAKTFEDDVKAGGLVGKVIIALGIIGVLLVVMRAIILMRASSNIQKIASKVNAQIEAGDIDAALAMCKKKASAASNVIAATLRNLKRDRDHIEDIISESILHESSFIDRFGSAILVIAAISPLLGLLGTVTGMISTFDIITEFGTGDPKLLSSGISEALLTTKFGLVVAIPLLLMGNLLSTWARQIKSDLEQAALHMINTHKN